MHTAEMGATPEGLELILDRVAGGDEAAMGDLFDATAPGLAVLLDRLLADGDRDEVLCRTFVDVWRDAPVADRQHGVMGWLSVIAIGHVRALRVGGSGGAVPTT